MAYTRQTKKEFIKECNTQRKANKTSWVFLKALVDGKLVEYKAYQTWVQVLRVDGVQYDSNMDISVKDYNAFLEDVFTWEKHKTPPF